MKHLIRKIKKFCSSEVQIEVKETQRLIKELHNRIDEIHNTVELLRKENRLNRNLINDLSTKQDPVRYQK